MIARTALLLAAAAAATLSTGAPDVVTGAVHLPLAFAAAGGPGPDLATGAPAAYDDRWELRAAPPAPWSAADPADSLYRVARDAMSRGDFGEAAELFRRIADRYPDSDYAPASLYYEAFALYRIGGAANLRLARQALDRQRERYPDEARRGDAPSLRARIDGELARRGDAVAAENVVRGAQGAVSVGGGMGVASAASPASAASTASAASVNAGRRGGASAAGAAADSCPPEEQDERIVALNALLQMDGERAQPLLRRVMERRDACSAPLRRRAVFLLAQADAAGREQLLLDAVRNDPDPEVRQQAIFWLSSVDTPRATDILGDLLRNSTDDVVRERALFALSNKDDQRAGQLMRQFAEQASAPRALRERAIFWLSNRKDAETVTYLRGLYGRLDDPTLKERVLFSLSQAGGGGEGQRWLLGVARDPKESEELRGRALFWASQGDGLAARDLAELYRTVDARPLKENIVFALAQRHDRASVDELMAIARREQDRQLRERAIFWLSQSRDPRVPDFLMEIIDRRP